MENSHSKVSPFAFTIKQLKERIIEQENLITSISTLKDEIEKIQFQTTLIQLELSEPILKMNGKDDTEIEEIKR